MILNKSCLWFLFYILATVLLGCSHTAPQLTEKERNVRIVAGIQATTLELMKTHTSVGTVTLPSEYAARVYAVSIGADIAQLIFIEYGVQYTYHFWKKK